MKPRSATEPGYKSFSLPGWTGHGRGIDLSAEYARMASGFQVNNPRVFEETAKDFFRDFPELYNFSPAGAMRQAAYVLYHICKQEVPNLYERVQRLRKKMIDDYGRLPDDERGKQYHLALENILRYTENTEKTLWFFVEVRKAMPRCSWNGTTLTHLISNLVRQEEKEMWDRKHPPGD